MYSARGICLFWRGVLTPKKHRSRRHKPSASSLRAGEGTRTLDVHLGNRLAFDRDWPSCIPNAVESTEVVLFVPCVSPYFRTRYGSCEAVVNETQPGEAWAWPGRVVVRELLKWRGYGWMRFSGQVDGGMSWRGALPQSLRTWLRSAPSTLLSKLMSAAAL